MSNVRSFGEEKEGVRTQTLDFTPSGAAQTVLQREYTIRMTRRFAALAGLRVVAVVMMAGLGCGRTELNLCKTGEPCHTTITTCPGGNCDGGQPDTPTGCSAGLEMCGAACTDVRTDPANCGSCGKQ